MRTLAAELAKCSKNFRMCQQEYVKSKLAIHIRIIVIVYGYFRMNDANGDSVLSNISTSSQVSVNASARLIKVLIL
jgi:hypothetical protein